MRRALVLVVAAILGVAALAISLAAIPAAGGDQNSTYAFLGLGLFALLGATALGFVVLRRTGQARQDAAVAASEERLRHALDAGRMVAWDLDLATGTSTRSQNSADILGLGTGAGADFFALIHPDDRAGVEALRDAALRGEADYDTEFRLVTENGRHVWVTDRARVESGADGRASRMVGILCDITSRKAAERAASQAQDQFSALADNVSQLAWMAEPDGSIFWYNKRWYEYTGTDLEAMRDWGWRAVHHPDKIDQIIEEVSGNWAAGEPWEGTYLLRSVGGEYRWFLTRAEPIRDSEGRLLRWFGTNTDIHEQRDTEAALRAGEARFSAAVAAVQGIVWTNTAAGEMEGEQPGWVNLTGQTPEEYQGFGWAKAVHPEDAQPTIDAWNIAVAERRSFAFEHRVRRRDGEWRHFSLRAIPMLAADGSIVEWVGVHTDVTEQREAERALRDLTMTLEERVRSATRDREEALARLHEAQKIETIGQLTGGVAHDFNNLLTPIMGGLDILSRKLAHDERAQRIAAGAMQSAERAKTLIQRLLSFGRRQTLQSRPLDVAQLIEGMRDLIERSIGPSVQVTVDIASDLPAVEADPNQLELAILNLCVNARDAMEHGGRLTISAAIMEPPDNEAEPECVAIRVSDTGKGMDEATLAKATEPFFTTKGVGQGTGLGLSMVYGLAAQSGGRLTLSSVVGEGTTVELVLPIANAAPETRPMSETPVIDHGTGTVMLVDDEELVRMSIADGLRELGFKVVEAASAAGALEYLREGLVPDVLVTDHMMPGMTGATLAREARRKLPALAVIMITGYANLRPDETRGLEVLAKPFHRGDLAARITDLVKASAAGNVVRLPIGPNLHAIG